MCEDQLVSLLVSTYETHNMNLKLAKELTR